VITLKVSVSVARWLYSLLEWQLLATNPTTTKRKLSAKLKSDLEELFDTLAFEITTAGKGAG
jgi:hypothetical protein